MASQFEIDKISKKIFGNKKFFFECGGSHPFEQSNTEFLESNEWTGIVVEPWTGYNELYKQHRPNTILENFALVSNDYKEEFIEGNFSDDLGGSVIKNAHGNIWNPKLYPTSTITKILDKHNFNEIHQMTIDVEGYEIEVLNGIDFHKIKIHFLVVEHHWGENFDFLTKFGFEKISETNNQHCFFNTQSDYLNNAKLYIKN
jgi:FkbM family methyltransferase